VRNRYSQQHAKAHTNIAAGVQFDMSVFLSGSTEGRKDWALISWSADLSDAACLKAVLAMRPSQQCLDWPDNEGLTALHIAAGRNAIDATKLLLQAGASIAAVATGDRVKGQTAVHYALGQRECSGELISLLIKHEANVLQRDGSGFSPLRWCVPQYGCKYKLDAARVILQEMKKEGKDADLRVTDTYNSSALAWCMLNAAKLPDAAILPMVQLLLKNGADAQRVEPILKHRTPLQVATDKKLLLCLAAMQQAVAASAATQQREAPADAAAPDNNSCSSISSISSNNNSSSSSGSSISRNSSSSSSSGSSSGSSNSHSRAASSPIASTAPEVLDLLDSEHDNNDDYDMIVEAAAAANKQAADSIILTTTAAQARHLPATATAADSSNSSRAAVQQAMTTSSDSAHNGSMCEHHSVTPMQLAVANTLQTSAAAMHAGADDDETESEYEYSGNSKLDNDHDSDDDYIDCDTDDGVQEHTASACAGTVDAAVVAAYNEAVAKATSSSSSTAKAAAAVGASATEAAAATTAAAAAVVAEQTSVTDERDRLIAELKAENAALREALRRSA
jgi:Ankyrin repeats (many copies)